jgi:predicted alpha/beta-fold hydrolase
MLGDPSNGIFERYFYKILRADVIDRYRTFKDLPRIELPRSLKIYEFDQLYTAPTCGFADVMDYYEKCSSRHLVQHIAIPCKILLAEDDPIISHQNLDGLDLPKNIDIFKTKKGGHMGYLGDPTSETGFHWLDSLLVDWIL